MAYRLNLSLAPTGAQFTPRALQSTLQSSAILLASLLLMLLIGTPPKSTSLITQASTHEVFELVRARSLALDFDPAFTGLKDNFMTNQKIPDSDLKRIYRDAGLSHLLALSGGQTSPAAFLICFVFAYVTMSLLRLIIPTIRAEHVKIIMWISLCVETCILGFLVCLFQATGALARALSIKSLALAGFLNRSRIGRSSARHSDWTPVLREVGPWIFVWTVHKNPTQDLSFLLSILGAKTAACVAISLSGIFDYAERHSGSGVEKRLFPACLRHIAYWTSVTSLTSALMCLFCFQLWPVEQVLPKVFANLIAGPVVLFVITPASLLLIPWVACSSSPAPVLLRDFLEWGLWLFHNTALAFSGAGDNSAEQGRRSIKLHMQVEWFEQPLLPTLLIIVCLSGLQNFHSERRAEIRY